MGEKRIISLGCYRAGGTSTKGDEGGKPVVRELIPCVFGNGGLLKMQS